MPNWLDETEPMICEGRIKVPYEWWVGETGSRFFVALRDEKKLLGRHCPACDVVFVPPRKSCPRCFGEDMAWKEVGPEGEVISWTIPHYEEDFHPDDPKPFGYAVVKLDGAGTGLTHLVGGFAPGQLRAGLRVKPVFRAERQGNILDIRYFEPVE